MIRSFTIKSRALGREITFSRPGSAYVFADLNGQPGALGVQICAGGDTMGNTIIYDGDDQKEFERICRRWYRQFVQWARKDVT